MERNYTVYKHTSPSGKVYIGITGQKRVEDRWRNGKGYIKQKFYRAIKKYGWDNIQHEVLFEGLTKKEAENMEIKLIAEYRSAEREFGYNDSNGGNCATTLSEEARKKISKTHKGKKLSEATKKKISRTKVGLYVGGKSPSAKKVYCENMVFDCAKSCAEYYGVNPTTMRGWLNNDYSMPKEWYDKGLRYEDKQMSDYQVYNPEEVGRKISESRKGRFTGKNNNFYGKSHTEETKEKMKQNNKNSKKVFCENIIFFSVTECAEYYGVNRGTMRDWLTKKTKTPKQFQTLDLRYATEKDIIMYPMYNKEIHGEKSNINICIQKTKLAVHCNGMFFETIKECAEYYSVSYSTMHRWLSGARNTPQKFKDLGLRYATEEDIQKYPVYIPE